MINDGTIVVEQGESGQIEDVSIQRGPAEFLILLHEPIKLQNGEYSEPPKFRIVHPDGEIIFTPSRQHLVNLAHDILVILRSMEQCNQNDNRP